MSGHAIAHTILDIEAVAGLLRCSVDTVRRIPFAELPHARIGRKNLYLMADIENLVRRRAGAACAPPSPLTGDVIDLLADDVRGRSQR
ncbi:MAG: helix-turn-helix domain-containing protein [Rhodospirillaceae bacterium]|nr:helix-turn-helix domain-containing protein [Rhodospirillaceae bacterium]MBT5079016.1 helix-turn-helix domain-containing protein [Rhodospirillaceae bacterium]